MQQIKPEHQGIGVILNPHFWWLKTFNSLSPLCTQTEPEMVQPSISSQGSNSSIQVSWNKPPGNVDNYTVFLEPEGREMKTMNTSVTFDGLSAGRNYSARVVTHSGTRNSSSTFVSNATCKSQTCCFCKEFLIGKSPFFTAPSVPTAM